MDCKHAFHILDTGSLSYIRYMNCKYFSSMLGVVFSLYVMVSFKEQGFPNLTKYSLCIFFSLVCIFDVISKKTLPNAGSQRFACLFFTESFIGFFLGGWCCIAWHAQLPWPGIESVPPAVEAQNLNHWTAGKVKSCVVLCLTFRSVANLELIFWGRRVILFISVWISNGPSTICWKDNFFPHWIVLAPTVEHHMAINVRIYFCIISCFVDLNIYPCASTTLTVAL